MTINVLSIDGGGIRGVGSAEILHKLELELGKPLHEAFDLFVGTSTGSILVGGIAGLGMSAEDIKKLYLEKGAQMFTRSLLGYALRGLPRAKYRTDRKGATLHDLLGDLRLGELERNFMATFYDVGAEAGPVFANGGPTYRSLPEPDDKYHDWPVWAVINASSSAPMYFDPAMIQIAGRTVLGVDGGLVANNPTVCAFVEARKLFGTDDIVVVSVGTGTSKLRFPRHRHWGILQWASPFDRVPMMEAMFDAQSAAVAYQMEHILAQRSFRFEFGLDAHPHVAMDDASLANQNEIIAAARAYLDNDETKKRLENAIAALSATTVMSPQPRLALPAGESPKTPLSQDVV